jgi:hypothetical protein
VSPFRQSAVSLAVIVVALAAAYAAWRLQPPPPPPPSAGIEPVFDFPASAVRAIDVESWQGALRATRDAGGWRVLSIELPSAAGADASAATPTPDEVSRTLDTLVGELAALPEIDRFAPGDRPLADFGLAEPQGRIVLELDSGERRTLELGSLTVTTAALYARVVPPGDVVQVGTLVFNDLAAALFRLRALGGTMDEEPAG